MIFNDDLCFIHVPKAAGMSVSKFLLKNLKNKNIHYLLPKGHATADEKKINGIQVHEGIRHENLEEAEVRLKKFNKKLSNFKVVIAVIRNPYDLEVSRFKYLQNGHEWDSGKDAKLAKSGNFKDFALQSSFWGKSSAEFEKYYSLRDSILDNMIILRFEDLSNQINIFLNDYLESNYKLGKTNSTKRKKYCTYYDADSEKAVYNRYKWIFDKGFYSREYFHKNSFLKSLISKMKSHNTLIQYKK
ncbi:hypothetical protein MLC35_01060 [Sulfurimonas sp. NW7]|uniref:hypothetical protein n=1 Tax=Sulfurimonas sp. NW7 TaxID=2922727 RepID=UPI003DA8AB24